MNYQIKKRDIGIVVLLSIVTLGIYYIYLMGTWANDINHLAKREKHNSILIVIVGVITLTLALLVWEIIYAYDLQKIAADRDTSGRNASLGSFVLILDVLAIAVGFLSGGLALIVSCGLGIWAYCLIQKELNILAEQELQQHPADG